MGGGRIEEAEENGVYGKGGGREGYLRFINFGPTTFVLSLKIVSFIDWPHFCKLLNFR